MKRAEIDAATVSELVLALRTATPAAYDRIEDEILARLDRVEKMVGELGTLFLPDEEA